MGIGKATDRSVVHLDMDTFFVSVERLKDRRLQGIPLLIGGTGDRGVVAACSYEARTFGIRSGMPVRMARKLCPHGVTISGDYEAYSEFSRMVTEIIDEEAPVYEKASIDEFFLDVSGMEKFFGTFLWARELRSRIIKETGLPISMGLSVNKMVSKVATSEAKPNGQLQIPSQEIQPFLAPMAVRKIPYIGASMARQLAYLGVRRILTLREIPRPVLERAFGRHGTFLFRRARGEDDSPIVSHREQKSLSTESTFGQDTMDTRFLKSTISRMVEKLGYQLRQQGRLTACISVKVRYANFETVSKQARIPYCASDEDLIAKAWELFDKCYEKRVRLRLVGVRFSDLVPGGSQIQLFSTQARQVELYHALDGLKDKYGGNIIHRASSLNEDRREGRQIYSGGRRGFV